MGWSVNDVIPERWSWEFEDFEKEAAEGWDWTIEVWFGLVSLFQWHINLRGLFNAKPIPQEEQ